MGAIFSCIGGICNSVMGGIETCISAVGGCLNGLLRGVSRCCVGSCDSVADCLSCRGGGMGGGGMGGIGGGGGGGIGGGGGGGIFGRRRRW